MFAAQPLVLVALVATGYFTPAVLLALLALPGLGRVWRSTASRARSAPPVDLPAGVWPLYLVAAAFWYTRRFGTFFLAGLLADVVLSRL